MKRAAIALVLLAGCKQYDHPSAFLEKGMQAAVAAALEDLRTAYPREMGGVGWSSVRGGTYAKPAHFHHNYEITFDMGKRGLPIHCLQTLSSRLPEYAAARGARVLTRGYSAPNRFLMTYEAGGHRGDVVVTIRADGVDIVANES